MKDVQEGSTADLEDKLVVHPPSNIMYNILIFLQFFRLSQMNSNQEQQKKERQQNCDIDKKTCTHAHMGSCCQSQSIHDVRGVEGVHSSHATSETTHNLYVPSDIVIYHNGIAIYRVFSQEGQLQHRTASTGWDHSMYTIQR
jgi:hypothetical protein